MEQFWLGRGLAVCRWVREIGGGMSPRRAKVTALMDAVAGGRVPVLVIAHKDRLARFGFGYREHVAGRAGCQIVVASPVPLSPERQLAEDLLAAGPTFSCRRYRPRNYRKALKRALAQDVSR